MDFHISHGLNENLPVEISPGHVRVTNDTAQMYVDMNNGTRLCINDVYIVDALPDNPIPNKLYLLANKLWVYKTEWICLNSLDEETLSQAIAEQIQDGIDLPDLDRSLGRYSTSTTWNTDETVYTEIYTYNGNNYKEVLTVVSETEITRELYINDILSEKWVTTETDTGVTTEYIKY